MKLRVINILPHPPAYEYIQDDNRPDIFWDTPSGSWVGLFRGDWPDLIGRELLKISNEFNYEVWRPDSRAERIYSHTFDDGLVHKIFPATKEKTIWRKKKRIDVNSDFMLKNLEQEINSETILHLNGTGHRICREIIQKFPNVPKLIQFHSRLSHPYLEFKRIRKNFFRNIHYYFSYKTLKRNKPVFFVYNNSKYVSTLYRYRPIGIERIFMGCDFEFWKSGNKNQAKKEFGIESSSEVFSMASRFFALKQIDRVIEMFTHIHRNQHADFKLLIAGHGEQPYEEYLRRVGQELIKVEKLEFLGFLNDTDMLQLYQASDLFISASKTEGGPVSVVKAIACETPVMVTNVGGVDDVLKHLAAGILFDPTDYGNWEAKISNFMSGDIVVNVAERKKVKEIFHWPKICNKFLFLYRQLAGT